MLCRKAKNAKGKGGSAQFFRHPLGDLRHPLKITNNLPPPERNPKTAPGPEASCTFSNTPGDRLGETNPAFLKSAPTKS